MSLVWYQRKEYACLVVGISDATEVKVSFADEGTLSVKALTSANTPYELKLDLFAEICSEKSSWKATGRSIEIRIEKKHTDEGFWPRLTKTKDKSIGIDWDHWVDEDDDGSNSEDDSDSEGDAFKMPPQEEYDEDNEEEVDSNPIDMDNWFTGQSEEMVYHRFIDSYRLRVEDDYTQRAEYRGIYDEQDPLPDFKEYLKNAVEKHVMPPWWNKQHEKKIIEMAQKDDWHNINFAVEKHDIVEKYGNPFEPMLLRMIAERVEE